MVIDEIRYDQVPRLAEDVEPSTKNQTEMERLLASPLDRLAAVVADLVLFVPAVTVLVAPFRRQSLEAQLLGSEDQWVLSLIAIVGGVALAWTLYQTIFICIYGATPGKRIMGLKVIGIWDQKSRPRPLAVFLRSIVWCLELALAGVPWLALYANERRRSFHDRVGDTIVISMRRKPAGLPGIPEMGIASGLSAAAVMVLGLVLTFNLMKLRPALHSANEAAEAMEEAGLLCHEVGEGRKEWMERGGKTPSRMSVALAMLGAETIGEECVRSEADLALWRNEEKALAYLGKAFSESGNENLYGAYLDKVCTVDHDSSECKLVQLLRADEDVAAEIDEPSEKAEQADAENRIEELIADLKSESPAYLRIWVIRHFMDQGQYLRALDWLESGAPERRLGYFFARERAKALWGLERKDEARLALKSSIETFAPEQRVEIAGWFCANETSDAGCSETSVRTCGWLSAAIDHNENWLSDPEVAVAYLRGESCRGDLSSERLQSLVDKMPGRDSRLYAEALLQLKNSKRSEAIATLRKLASGRDTQNVFFVEANSRLVELASTVEELKPVKNAWLKLSPDESWKHLGRRLTEKFNSLRAWDQALEVGMKIVEADQLDRQVYRHMVVAAFRSGNHRMALGFFENLVHIEERMMGVIQSSATHSREPASIDGFDEVARELSAELAEDAPVKTLESEAEP